MNAGKALFDRSLLAFFAVAVAVLALRIAGLRASPLSLHFDEAQYWGWSRELAWGYFSKPPLIAWAIAGATSLFGNAEWAVRLAAPIAQTFAAASLYVLGRTLYGSWAGFWAGVLWLCLPAVFFSSFIISTDTLLLAFWSFALLAFCRLIATRAWTWAVLLGVAIGLGALAKYAMLYFLISAALAAWWSKPARSVVFDKRGAVAALVALLALAPNVAWNFTHGFATVQHTASNARFTANFINPGELAEFLVGQAFIMGPLLFVALIALFWSAGRRNAALPDEERVLLAFALPPLAIMTVLAFVSRANANWAVAAYPAAIVWIAGRFAKAARPSAFIGASLAVNVALGALLAAAAIAPSFADNICVPPGFSRHQLCLANSIKRSRAWDETAREIAARAQTQERGSTYSAILVDHRALFYELAYYWRDAPNAHPPVRMWLLHGDARNSAEAAAPMLPQDGARVLVVNMVPGYVPLVSGDFTVFRTVDHVSQPLGGGTSRELDISVGEGFAPARRDATFERRVRGDDTDQ